MKQAIKIDKTNIYEISRAINGDLSPAMLWRDRGRWVVAEKLDEGTCTERVNYSILEDRSFFDQYQVQPLPEALTDLRLEIWRPVIHRHELPEEGVTYVLHYRMGPALNEWKVVYLTRKEAFEAWDKMLLEGIDYPDRLERRETLRIA